MRCRPGAKALRLQRPESSRDRAGQGGFAPSPGLGLGGAVQPTRPRADRVWTSGAGLGCDHVAEARL